MVLKMSEGFLVSSLCFGGWRGQIFLGEDFFFFFLFPRADESHLLPFGIDLLLISALVSLLNSLGELLSFLTSVLRHSRLTPFPPFSQLHSFLLPHQYPPDIFPF